MKSGHNKPFYYWLKLFREYELFGFIPTNRHLIGVEGAKAEETIFLLGTDLNGRDLWSRLMYATRISMTIGLVSVALSLFLGLLLGGVSGSLTGFGPRVKLTGSTAHCYRYWLRNGWLVGKPSKSYCAR